MNPQTIDEYIAGFPPDVRMLLEQIRATIKHAAPDAQEAIKYQIPTFVLHGNLVSFAGYQNHIGFYPVPTGMEAFKDELAPYVAGKGTARFPLDQPHRAVPGAGEPGQSGGQTKEEVGDR